jgi:hypothetical protein
MNVLIVTLSMGRRPLMGGNWKLNPRKVSDAVGLATEVILSRLSTQTHNDVIVFTVIA